MESSSGRALKSLVPKEGVEPSCPQGARDFESRASASSATSAGRPNCRRMVAQPFWRVNRRESAKNTRHEALRGSCISASLQHTPKKRIKKRHSIVSEPLAFYTHCRHAYLGHRHLREFSRVVICLCASKSRTSRETLRTIACFRAALLEQCLEGHHYLQRCRCIGLRRDCIVLTQVLIAHIMLPTWRNQWISVWEIKLSIRIMASAS